jgi:O-antigen/teichoic acid export membrane protein
MLRAQGRYDDVQETRNVTWTWLVGEAAAIAIAFWVYVVLTADSLSDDELLGLALVPIVATFTTLYGAYETFIKNQKEFKLWARFSLTQLAIDWSIVIWVLAADLTGLLIGLAVGWALRLGSVAWVVRHRRIFQLKLALNWQRLKALLSFGVPLAVWNVGYTLIPRLDSLAIGSDLGTTALGLYYLGPQIALTLASIPNALSVVSYPALMERYGREGIASLEAHVKDYMRSMSLIAAPAMTGLGIFALPVLVNNFLPDFEEGLPAMKVAIFSIIFSQPALLFLQIMLAEKLVRRLITITAVAIAIEGGMLAAGIAGGLTIEWAAWSAIAGQATFTLLALIVVIRQLRLPRPVVLGFWGRLPLAWAAFLGIGVGVDALIDDPTDLVGSLAAGAAQFALFLAAGALAVLLIDRDAFRASRALLRLRS